MLFFRGFVKYNIRTITQYVQGNSPEPGIREYFYFIDHQGQLFLDDARIKNFTSCFKDKEFLVFFFKRLRFNDGTAWVNDFPYLSLCGRERNYVRCDDLPIVFTELSSSSKQKETQFIMNYCGDKMRMPFNPAKLCMLPSNGRVYHSGPENLGGVGLVKSALAIEFSKHFIFEDSGKYPTAISWNNETIALDGSTLKQLQSMTDRNLL